MGCGGFLLVFRFGELREESARGGSCHSLRGDMRKEGIKSGRYDDEKRVLVGSSCGRFRRVKMGSSATTQRTCDTANAPATSQDHDCRAKPKEKMRWGDEIGDEAGSISEVIHPDRPKNHFLVSIDAQKCAMAARKHAARGGVTYEKVFDKVTSVARQSRVPVGCTTSLSVHLRQ